MTFKAALHIPFKAIPRTLSGESHSRTSRSSVCLLACATFGAANPCAFAFFCVSLSLPLSLPALVTPPPPPALAPPLLHA